MKLTVNQSELILKLSEANRFISNRPLMNGLSGISLSAIKANIKSKSKKSNKDNSNDILQIKSSSGGVIYQASIFCNIIDEGECFLPNNLLLSFIKTLDEGRVDLELNGDNLLIKQGKVKTNLSTIAFENYSLISEADLENKFSLPVSKLIESGKKVVIAASNDETKPVLTSLVFEMAQPNALVSTDGFRLFRRQVDLSLDEKGSFLFPARLFKDFLAILEGYDQNIVDCYITTDRQIMLFDLGQVKFQVGSIQGEFPNYSAIVPQNTAFSAILDKLELEQRIKQVMIVAKELSSIIIFNWEANEVVITSQENNKGKAEAAMSVTKIDGEPVSFACNGKYILDYLQVMEGDELRIQGTESLKPVVLSPVGNDSEIYLIMPFKI